MSDKTGLAMGTLSVFHKVAGDVGVATEAVDKGLTKAARSITEFEAGSNAAAKGFQILGITTKDFAGLNPDQKIALVTDRLGKMAPGFQKATAAQLIFSRGGAEMIPVLNAIAAEGFDKATAATAKLGLLLDQTTTDSFREAKAAMQELEDAGKGIATQFEAGLLPAIADVGEAFVDSVTQGGVSFEGVGKYAGEAVRGIALIFIGLGQTLGTVAASIADIFMAAWSEIKVGAETEFGALSQAASGHLVTAFKTLEGGIKSSTGIVSDEVARQKAIYGSLRETFKGDYADLFPSEDEEKRRAKERLARLRPDKQDQEPGQLREAEPSGAAAKAQLALTEKQLQDEIELFKAYFAKRAEEDKAEYDRGEISLEQYFARRKADVQAAAQEEITILQKQRDEAQAAADAAGARSKTASTPQNADKLNAEKLQFLAKVEDLNTKIALEQSAASTKQGQLDADQHAKTLENDQKIQEFEKQLADSQKDRVKSAQAELEVKTREYQLALQQRGTDSPAQINAKVAALRQAIEAQAEFDQAQAKTQEDQKAFELAKQQIEIEARAGRKSPLETEAEINQLLRERLPLLQADAAAEAAAARKTGSSDNIAAAQNAQQGVQNLQASATSLGAQLGGPISQDFTLVF